MGLTQEEVVQYNQLVNAIGHLAGKAGHHEVRIRLGRDNRLPPIPAMFINTVPKSGSMFIFTQLAHILSAPRVRISNGLFPNDTLVWDLLEEFAEGNAVTQEHLPATETNIRLLRAHIDRVVVHVRDPRQATLSWIHDFEKVEPQKRSKTLGIVSADPPLPGGYFDLSFEEKVEWQIENHLPEVVRWIEKWIEVADDPDSGIDILFTNYEEMRTEPEALMLRILDFYDVDPEPYAIRVDKPTVGKLHYRRGSPDEWRSSFTPAQCAVATKALPSALCERFGWSTE